MSNSSPPSTSIITLTTDFGSQDYFIGAMKAAIVSINPDVAIVDITHEIPPQDIHAAAFNLLACYRDFPTGTIHVAVVDPGVGSQRRAILIECADRFFVGPDNGLFSWICEREGNFIARELANRTLFRQPVSSTFHGRDVFAPAAGFLSRGRALAEFGEILPDIVRLESLETRLIDEATIEGRIIHIDRFGNCVTNFTTATLSARDVSTSWRLLIYDREISSFRQSFADGATGEIFGIAGSAGFLEVSARNASAAELLNARTGDPVRLVSSQLSEIRARAH